jgi:preprotein translocase subunit SecE
LLEEDKALIGNIVQFIRETRQELKKVSWPSRNELMDSTTVVIFTTFLMAAFVGVIDFVLSILIRFFIR